MKTSKVIIWANIISLLFFIFILLNVLYNNFFIRMDSTVNSFMSGIENSFLTNFSIAVGFIFDIKIMIVISLIFSAYLWIKFSKNDSVFFVSTMLLNGVILYILKGLMQRFRPLNSLVIEDSFAFPSCHAATAVVFFGFLVYLISKKRELRNLKLIGLLISVFMILLICFTRLYLNVHWFSDVIGGIAVGIFILTGCILLRGILKNR